MKSLITHVKIMIGDHQREFRRNRSTNDQNSEFVRCYREMRVQWDSASVRYLKTQQNLWRGQGWSTVQYYYWI